MIHLRIQRAGLFGSDHSLIKEELKMNEECRLPGSGRIQLDSPVRNS